jgi:hypothetical protein
MRRERSSWIENVEPELRPRSRGPIATHLGTTVNQHSAIVDAWLERSAKDLSPELRLRLFEAALSTLWNRVKTTLGEVTLTAIAERVLHDTAEAFPLFSSLKVNPTRGFECRELSKRIGSVQSAELNKATRFVIVEFLTVLGRLTAEILTPELHAELSHVALPRAVLPRKRRAVKSGQPRRKERTR